MKLKNILSSISFCALAIGTAVGAVSLNHNPNVASAEEGVNVISVNFNSQNDYEVLYNGVKATKTTDYVQKITYTKCYDGNGGIRLASGGGTGSFNVTFKEGIEIDRVDVKGTAWSGDDHGSHSFEPKGATVTGEFGETGTKANPDVITATFATPTNHFKFSTPKGSRKYVWGFDAYVHQAKVLQSVTATLKTGTTLYVNDTIKGSDFDVVATYDKGNPVTITDGKDVKLSIDSTGANPVDELKLSAASTDLYVVLGGKVSEKITVSAKEAKIPEKLELTIPADYVKTGYFEGDTLSNTGITAKVKYSNYPELADDVTPTTIKFAKVDGTELVDNKITAELIGDTGTFSVKVIATYKGALTNDIEVNGEATIEGITAEKNKLTLTWENPEKAVTYFTGETFNLNGSKLVAKYNNPVLHGNSDIKLDNQKLTMNIEGKEPIAEPDKYKPTIEDNGKNVSFTYTDDATGLSATSATAKLSVTALTTQFVWSNPTLSYYVGDKISFKDANMSLVYNNTGIGTDGVENLNLSDITVYVNGVKFNTNTSLTAEHNGAKIILSAKNIYGEEIKSTEQTLIVNAIEVSKVEWTDLKTSYYQDQTLVGSNTDITITYNNGQIETQSIAKTGVVVTLGGTEIDANTYKLQVADNNKELVAKFTSELYGLEITTKPIAITVVANELVTYTKLTDASSLTQGDEIVIYSNEYFLSSLNSDYYKRIAENKDFAYVETIDNVTTAKIRPSADVKTFMVTFADQDGMVSLLANDTLKYVVSDYSGNKAYESSYIADNTSLTISIESSVAHIHGNGERELRYNASAKRFAFYNGTQEAIEIFVKKGDTLNQAKAYANYFHASITNLCDSLGTNSKINDIALKWKNLETNYNKLSDAAKKEFAAHELEDNILGQAFRLYKIIVNKYSQEHAEIVNFAIDKDGNKVQLANNNIKIMDSNTMVMIALCCAILGTTLIAIVFLVKRKQSN